MQVWTTQERGCAGEDCLLRPGPASEVQRPTVGGRTRGSARGVREEFGPRRPRRGLGPEREPARPHRTFISPLILSLRRIASGAFAHSPLGEPPFPL